jgi:hypothetical protein
MNRKIRNVDNGDLRGQSWCVCSCLQTIWHLDILVSVILKYKFLIDDNVFGFF